MIMMGVTSSTDESLLSLFIVCLLSISLQCVLVFYVLVGDEPDLGENLLQALPLSNAAQAEGDAAHLDEIQR